MTIDNPKVVCWESNCFCAWFNKEAGRYDVCNAIIEDAKKRQVRLYTSYITLVEVVKIRNEYPSEAEDAITEFFRNPYITLVAVDWAVTRISRDLIRRFKHLQGADAIHLATAIRIKADVLHTYDHDDLLKLDGQIPGYSLRIKEPTYTFQTKMPDSQSQDHKEEHL